MVLTSVERVESAVVMVLVSSVLGIVVTSVASVENAGLGVIMAIASSSKVSGFAASSVGEVEITVVSVGKDCLLVTVGSVLGALLASTGGIRTGSSCPSSVCPCSSIFEPGPSFSSFCMGKEGLAD